MARDYPERMDMRTSNGNLRESNKVSTHTRLFSSLSRHPELFSDLFGNNLNLRPFAIGKALDAFLGLEGDWERMGRIGRARICFFRDQNRCRYRNRNRFQYLESMRHVASIPISILIIQINRSISDQPFCSIEIFIRSIVHMSNSLRYIITGKIHIMYVKKRKSKINIEYRYQVKIGF